MQCGTFFTQTSEQFLSSLTLVGYEERVFFSNRVVRNRCSQAYLAEEIPPHKPLWGQPHSNFFLSLFKQRLYYYLIC
jgi:hypothetical protein